MTSLKLVEVPTDAQGELELDEDEAAGPADEAGDEGLYAGGRSWQEVIEAAAGLGSDDDDEEHHDAPEDDHEDDSELQDYMR